MILAAGSRLGPYEILSALGAGGMGEVYKARDTRLDRTVAVKVLPQHLSSSAEVRQRFEREAKTISQLSHSHICALYDVGNQDGVEYLVMEYLEGETLAERLVKGHLPLEQTLRFGIEIADALDKAHRQGIVHRDLKPSNVMLTKSGIKLLDFGLAKYQKGAQAAPVSRLSRIATEAAASAPLTEKGTVLGTFQYMAPEQLEGKEIDTRSDVFALGAVLYEMATGKKAFSGTSQASLIGAILRDDPAPISQIAPLAPPALSHVVKTCLAKDPEDRFQTAHDLKLELQWIAEGGSQTGMTAPVAARRRSRERIAWTIAVAALLAAAIAAFGYLRRAPAEAHRIRSFLLPPEKSEFEVLHEGSGSLTVSPDGWRVTFATKGPDGKTSLWVQSLDEPSARTIPGTEGGHFPFWSPDSRFLAFFAGGKLKRVDLTGSPPVTLCDAAFGRSGSWSRDGVILFSPEATSSIYRVSVTGGAVTPVTKLDASRGETTHRWATFLPDGRHFLYMAASHSAGTMSELNAIYLGELGSNEKRLLLPTLSNAIYASGHLLYVRGNVLLAQPFDAGHARLSGDPVPLTEGVLYNLDLYRGEFSASENGALVYVAAAVAGNSRLYWHDRSGKRLGDPIGDPANYMPFRVGPDGRHIAAQIFDPGTGTADIWILDSRGVRTRFTFGGSSGGIPIWSPDGSRIAYAKGPPHSGVYAKASSGAGQEELLYGSKDRFVEPTGWSSDGRFLSVDVSGGKTKSDIWILPLSGDRKAYPFLATEFDEFGMGFSPDGGWFFYASDESGRRELYVTRFPGPGGKWQISTGGGFAGGWFRGGKEIDYVGLDGNIQSVQVNAGETSFEIGSPKALFSIANWAWAGATPNAERFIGAERLQAPEKPRIALITNWTAGLAKK